MTWPEYPSAEQFYFGDGTTYGTELGRISPEGNIYGQQRMIREWLHFRWWDGRDWVEMEIAGQAESFDLLPSGSRPFGEIWRVKQKTAAGGYDWVGYYFDSQVDTWKPLKWRAPVDAFSELPRPGFQVGEARVVVETDVPVKWNGFEWQRLMRHSTLEQDEPEIHLPPGFLPMLTPDARVVFISPVEIGIEAVKGGSGRVWVNGEWITAQRSASVLNSLASLEWDSQEKQLVPALLEPDTEYWIYLANTLDIAFRTDPIPADATHNAAPAWDYRGKLFLSRTPDVDGYLSNEGSGKNARLVGKVQTDSTAAATGGPFFLRELDISLISRTTNFPETYREFSDYRLEFLDQDTVGMVVLDGCYGQIYVAGTLEYLGDNFLIDRGDPRVEWDDELEGRLVYETSALEADQAYFLYLAGNVDPFNFNAENPDTQRPWMPEDAGSEGHYDAAVDMRLRPFLSAKIPDHGRMAEEWPGYYTRWIGQIRTDANGRFINARDLSMIRQPTLDPTYFDGLAEVVISRISDVEFRIAARRGTSGIVNVRGAAVQAYELEDPRCHVITVQSVVQAYYEAELTQPLADADAISTYPDSELHIYLANGWFFWGNFANQVFASFQAPTGGYLSRNWPGNNARWIAKVLTDANAQFTGSFLLDGIVTQDVSIDDRLPTLNTVFSSAKINALLAEIRLSISIAAAWEAEKTAGIPATLRWLTNTQMLLEPHAPGSIVVFPNLTYTILPDEGLTLDVAALAEYSEPFVGIFTNEVRTNDQRTGWYAMYAVDGDTGANDPSWRTNGPPTAQTPKLLGIDLGNGGRRCFDAVCIIAGNSYGAEYPGDLELSGSNLDMPDIANDNLWTQLGYWDGLTFPGYRAWGWFLSSGNMRSYRHYRFKITKTWDGQGAAVTVGQFYLWPRVRQPSAMQSNNAPWPQICGASSEAAPAWRAFDGENGTGWQSAVIPSPETPQRIMFTHGAITAANRCQWRTINWPNAPKDFKIEGSNVATPNVNSDGDWTTLLTVTGYNIGGGTDSQIFTLPQTESYKWFALRITANQASGYYTILDQLNFVHAARAYLAMTGAAVPAPQSATATSYWGGGYEPWRAFSPTAANGWVTMNDLPQSIAIDLGAGHAQIITGITLRNRYNPAWYPTAFSVAGSNLASPDLLTEEHWIALKSVVNYVLGQSLFWVSYTAYRHIRIRVTAGSDINRLGIGWAILHTNRGTQVYAREEGLSESTDAPTTYYPALTVLEPDAILVGHTT